MDRFRFIPNSHLSPFPLHELFSREAPFVVDVGCGKGRFLLAHARRHPEMNFLGIDRMLRRIRKIDRKVQNKTLTNIRLLRMDAYYAISYLLPEKSVSTYFIYFPDPWPKKRHHANRLFDDAFLKAIHRTLLPNGVLHFATDHLPYFDEVQTILFQDKQFAPCDPYLPSPEETSDFELQFSDKPIGRCSVKCVPIGDNA